MNKYRMLAVFVVGASLILAACGSSGTVLNATLSDTDLTPDAFTAAPGAHVTFTVNNTGTAERDCVFFDVATMKLFPGQSQWSLAQIGPGTTKSLEFDAPAKPATYKIDCGTAGFSGQPRQPVAGLDATFDVK
jgi:hypothetical protein